MLRLEKRGRAFKPDQPYFEHLVAKAIMFRSAEKLIGALQLGGYRAQTVTYTLAKILNVTGQRVDLRAIWRQQECSPALREAIEDLAPLVHATIVRTAGARNISEWAKKEDCWKAVLDLEWSPPAGLTAELTTASSRTRTTSDASINEQLTTSEQADMTAVADLEHTTWFALAAWAKETGSLQPWQRGLAFSLGKLASSGRTPSRKQVVQGAAILTEAKRLGFAG